MSFAGHSGVDLIDALDEAVIRSVHEGFPSHSAAAAAYEREAKRAAGERPPARKSFYEREYGIPAGNHAYPPLAQAHVRAGVRPPALEVIVSRHRTRARIPRELGACQAVARDPYDG